MFNVHVSGVLGVAIFSAGSYRLLFSHDISAIFPFLLGLLVIFVYAWVKAIIYRGDLMAERL
jgi:hypothetical protein